MSHSTGHVVTCPCWDVEFDHGLPCRVKNMTRGTQPTKTEAEGRGFRRY